MPLSPKRQHDPAQICALGRVRRRQARLEGIFAECPTWTDSSLRRTKRKCQSIKIVHYLIALEDFRLESPMDYKL